MASLRWNGVGPVDLLYFVVVVAGVVGRQPSIPLSLWMALFALLVALVDWVEARQLVRRGAETRRGYATLLALTLPVLGAWYLLATRPPSALAAYFGLLAAVFFLQALRDATVLALPPVELLGRGYANLVAVYLVFGVAADAVDRLQVGLVIVGLLVYLVRKWFRWGEDLLAWLGPGPGS